MNLDKNIQGISIDECVHVGIDSNVYVADLNVASLMD